MQHQYPLFPHKTFWVSRKNVDQLVEPVKPSEGRDAAWKSLFPLLKELVHALIEKQEVN